MLFQKCNVFVCIVAALLGPVECRLRNRHREVIAENYQSSSQAGDASSSENQENRQIPYFDRWDNDKIHKERLLLSPSFRKSTDVHVDFPLHDGQLETSFEEFSPPTIDTLGDDQEDPIIVVIVGFQSANTLSQAGMSVYELSSEPTKEDMIKAVAEQLATNSNQITVEDAVAALSSGTISIPQSMVPLLESMEQVRYAEPDRYIHEDNVYVPGETIGYSIADANGNTYHDFPYSRAATHSCSDPDAMILAVVDGGMDSGHWDFDFCGINPVTGQPIAGKEVRCMGKQFLPSTAANEGQDWYNTRRDHGCHVTGILAASGVNGKGVAGMVADEDICLMTVRVFADDGSATMSKVKEGIFWAVDNGAKVINMSIGTSSDSAALRDAIDYALANNVILVASAGNSNTDGTNYPASYSDVLGVASVNDKYSKSWFSNYGGYVDIAAVGEDVLSTKPRIGESPETTIEISGSSDVFEGHLLIYAAYIGIYGVEGSIVDCGTGNNVCPGNGGHICLVQKSGGASFYSKALNCLLSNGAGTIIYNDSDDVLLGNLGEDSNSVPLTMPIPVVGVKNSIGNQLLAFNGTEIQLYNLLEKDSEPTTGYMRKSGTSMASPLVAGTAAVLWRECPQCSSDHVIDCILDTALDLGNVEEHGNGILQADLAFYCLVGMSCCSGSPFAASQLSESSATAEMESEAVTTSGPAVSPEASIRESQLPTSEPSIRPTLFRL
ncbi:hypothetical protein ACA910_010626 [Epithemia clementina (nom. ined.)]